MASGIPMGGFQLGPSLNRRLSRLYNDTKKSSDFVKEPVQHAEADPEIKSLHRKLKIQKDRLVSWGLEWSDPTHSAEVYIDSSLSKAGLSEVVGSIMSTIKDILAEAEPLWNSSKQLTGESNEPYQPPKRGEKIRMVVWDKNRFEDLIRDLTTSIDTLYDLSRTRSSYAQHSSAARERLQRAVSSPTEDYRPFESTRIQTPQQIDPSTLMNLRDMQAVPMTEAGSQEPGTREIVFMGKQAYAELMQRMGAQIPYGPLLLEYAPFDSLYSITGITPPMAKFERLSSGLQADPQRSSSSWTGLPRLLAYFEDMENSRFGLVYRFPRTFNPVTYENLTQNPLYSMCSLGDLLARPDFEPKLEAKFRLAANLANTVFDMHARGITHGNLLIDNISFCNAVSTDPEISGMSRGEVDIRRPLVSSFDLFSDPQSQDEPEPFTPYRHPLDPKNSTQSPLSNNADSKTLDLYSLAMILISVGLWNKLESILPDVQNPVVSDAILDQLAIRCGTLYMKAVQTCLKAVDQEIGGQHTVDEIARHVEFKASRYLEACCILDGVSNLEERLGDDLSPAPPALQIPSEPVASGSGSSKETKSEKTSIEKPTPKARKSEESDPSITVVPVHPELEVRAKIQARQANDSSIKEKARLYPHVPLPPDVVEQWNSVLMPEINSALKAFYRKNPESVEISLESIGESPQRTKPTILVVCTSVNKVRAILKKKLGVLFDGTRSNLGLKVCKGQVLRSRKQVINRSMANSDDTGDVIAANPSYQPTPQNGASIGAWIGDRHLPPVSLGGLIVVDDKPYGMTVHHMLDDPDSDQAADDNTRSMAGGGLNDLAAWYAQQYSNTDESSPESSENDDYACEFSDTDSEAYSESAITSEASDDGDYYEEEEQFTEPGDIPGIEPGCGEGFIITQPALDDVASDFYPSAEDKDQDHLDTFRVGEMYASSGIRRRKENGLVHEIDWALFEFEDDRQPSDNFIPKASNKHTRLSSIPPDQIPTILPTSIAPSHTLPGLQVQCMARTSGLQTGTILPTLTSVKILGRASPSHTYQISGTPSLGLVPNRPNRPSGSGDQTINSRRQPLPMGIPGDSGAWVVERDGGSVCGHILAWSSRKRVAYICPMEVLVRDIAEVLEAEEIRLPGPTGAIIYQSYEDRTPGVSRQASKSSTRTVGGGYGGGGGQSISRQTSAASARTYIGQQDFGSAGLGRTFSRGSAFAGIGPPGYDDYPVNENEPGRQSSVRRSQKQVEEEYLPAYSELKQAQAVAAAGLYRQRERPGTNNDGNNDGNNNRNDDDNDGYDEGVEDLEHDFKDLAALEGAMPFGVERWGTGFA
ncbi:hypothetical protein NEUTE1DRAFT_146735 [Neurospora tetrasperma FGSC 2508]|uniref:Protein kinase domain-containing protein n=1 Tax=Neurospora tetrasperma (strain FGSC 2508 / ATCC MYA-4615 / P0657) TaxID=510951 RepID=F8ML01_NEUT8|nr:uncharacterized protein NEUTE1DRAFT_146735 [Neurospora tetrasperma FGSC 2508]EGO58326.1 hypothetical protein NEUTE1DRAFT_146735 [Neurospora tetrasperma FGSC 2508]EGZ71352.1 hypothetical protein NEUTE2DRAFT_109792 [Neurospora tetrasperma FGSC 2509]